MLDQSAPVTHPLGNRRNGELVFKVEGREVEQVGLLTLNKLGRNAWNVCPVCMGKGKIMVPDTCAYCGGEGCGVCKGEERKFEVQCPEPGCTARNSTVGLQRYRGGENHGDRNSVQRRKGQRRYPRR